MVGQRRKFEKKHWLKRPKAVPQKTKFGPKHKWFKISYLEFFFFENKSFGHATFSYLSRHSRGHYQSFFNFRFPSRKSQRQQKLILRTSVHLTLKIICSRNTNKNLSDFTKFPANMFLFGVRKNICIAPFLDAQELHSWSTLKANVCIFLYISVRKYLFQRRCKVLSSGGWDGGGWIISLRRFPVWVLQNVLQFFNLIEIF